MHDAHRLYQKSLRKYYYTTIRRVRCIVLLARVRCVADGVQLAEKSARIPVSNLARTLFNFKLQILKVDRQRNRNTLEYTSSTQTEDVIHNIPIS